MLQPIFEAGGERGATGREDLGICSDSKGKCLQGRTVAVEAR